MSLKKKLKKGAVLGALMAFVITGNAHASILDDIGGVVDNAISEETKNAIINEFKKTEEYQALLSNAIDQYIKENGYTSSADLQNKINDYITSEAFKDTQAYKDIIDAAEQAYIASDEYREAISNEINSYITSDEFQASQAYKDIVDAAEQAYIASDEYQKILTEKGEAAAAEALKAYKEGSEYKAAIQDAITSYVTSEEYKNSDAYKAIIDKAVEDFKNSEAYQSALNAAVDQFKNSDEYKALTEQLKEYESIKEIIGGTGDIKETIEQLNAVKDDLHKVASLAGTVEETIEKATAKAAEYEALAKENAKWVQEKVGNFETKLEANIAYTEGVLKDKLNAVEGKLNAYEGALADNISKVEDKITQNVTKVEGVLKEQAGILKDVQENVIYEISYDKATDSTVVDHNLTVNGNATISGKVTAGSLETIGDAEIGNDLTVGNNASIGNDLSVGNNLTVSGSASIAGALDASSATITNDLTVGDSILVNEGKPNQVLINSDGIKVGTGSVYITGQDVSIGKIGEAGSIQLSTLGDVDNLKEEIKTSTQYQADSTVVGAINAESALREAGDAQTLQSAKDYADDKDKDTLDSAKDYTDELANGAVANNTAAIKDNTDAINGLNQRLGKMNGKINKVGAGAAALAALHPLEYDPDDKLTFSAGMGNYAGENAAALGAFYRPNEKLMFSLGGTMGNGEDMVNLGVSIGLDGATGLAKMSKRELIQKVNSMEAEMAELRALVVKLAAEKK